MSCLSSWNSEKKLRQVHLALISLTGWIWKRKSENEFKDRARLDFMSPVLVPCISSKVTFKVDKSWDRRFKKAENVIFSSTDPEDTRLNASSGSFASPRYQGPSSLLYANNFRATISISIPGDFGIIFTFSEFDLETKYNDKCLDYLEVRLYVTQWPQCSHCPVKRDAHSLAQTESLMILIGSSVYLNRIY